MQGYKESIHNQSTGVIKKSRPKPSKTEKTKTKAKEDKIREQTTISTLSKNSHEDARKKKKIKRNSVQKKQNFSPKDCRHSFDEHPDDSPFKINLISNSNVVRCQYNNMLSFREYCSVEGEWIPLLSGTQRQKLVNLIPSNNQSEDRGRQKTYEAQQVLLQQRNFDQLISQLENDYLPHDDLFTEIPYSTKQHYIAVLSQTLKKLVQSDDRINGTFSLSLAPQLANQQEKPIRPSLMENEVEAEVSPSKYDGEKIVQQPENEDDTQRRVENLIRTREAEQLIVCFNNQGLKKVSGFTTMFQFTEVLFGKICNGGYVERILANLRIAEGYPKLLKLKTLLSGDRPYSSTCILPEEVFEETVDENQVDNYVEMFVRCIFDALNSELIRLRPYYDTNGETFPWSFKMSVPITFFEINEQNIGLAILEARSKVISNASQLCGMILPDWLETKEGCQQSDKYAAEREIMEIYRNKKEMISVREEILKGELDKKFDESIENYSTVLVVGISEILLGEFCAEIAGLLHRG